MTTFLFSNNSGSTLSGAITNTATSLSLAAGGGALFPNPTSGQLFIITAIDAATGLLREIMHCTARATDTLTVVRAQEGTTALNWNSGDLIQSLVTAGMMGQFIQQGANPTTNIFFGGTDTGSVNAIVTTVTPAVGALADGMVFEIQPAHTNTSTTVTMNISALGPLSCLRADGTALRIGDLTAAGRALFSYDVTANAFYVMTPNIWASTPQTTVLTTGSGTYTTPINSTYLAIEMIGGGGGGGGSGTGSPGVGTAGTATTFGTSLLTANGAPATPANTSATPPTLAVATGGDINIVGGAGSPASALAVGTSVANSAGGASTPLGSGGTPGAVIVGNTPIAAGNASGYGAGGGSGGYGAGSSGSYNTGWGGNAGAYLKKIITSPLSTYAYAVGAAGSGGAAGTGGAIGGAGAPGLIRIVAYFQ